MHETADRDEHCDVERPRRNRGRPPPPEQHDDDRRRDHDDGGREKHRGEQAYVFRRLVIGREPERCDERRGVVPEAVGAQREASPRPVLREGRKVRARRSRGDREERGGERQRDEGDLFADSLRPGVKPPQRIPVEDQERRRQRDRDLLRQQARRHRQERERAPGSPSKTLAVLHSSAVAEQGEEVERPAEDVAAIRRPRHGLRMERVNAERKAGNRCADGQRPSGGAYGHVPERVGRVDELPRQERDEPCIERVQHEARQMKATRIHAGQGVGQGEAQPREGHVVPEQRVREHPADLLRAEPAEGHVACQDHVVVPRHELSGERGEERDRRYESDTDRQTDPDGASSAGPIDTHLHARTSTQSSSRHADMRNLRHLPCKLHAGTCPDGTLTHQGTSDTANIYGDLCSYDPRQEIRRCSALAVIAMTGVTHDDNVGHDHRGRGAAVGG